MQGEIFNSSYRSREIAEILERSSAETNPVILVGDFNMADLSDEYRAIRESYSDAFGEVGQGFGWTFSLSSYPAFLRLDYLFFSEGIRPITAEVLADRWGSDHHPILLSLVITP
jgi:endonuclease/exonuclease/phosphatase (EEP) superfamily protein YafD